MTKTAGGRNMASAVRETLDSIVSPSVRDTILARALAEAKKKDLPAEPTEFDGFVRGPLHDELVRSLGPELGTSVAEELERISAVAARDAKVRDKVVRSEARNETVRPGKKPPAVMAAVAMPEKRKGGSRSTLPSPEPPPESEGSRNPGWIEQQRRGFAPTLPAASGEGRSVPTEREVKARIVTAQPASADFPAGTAKALGVIGTLSIDPRSSARPVVYIASTNAEMVRTFENWLSGRALVRVISGPGPLVQAFAQPNEKRSVVVLDGKSPSIRPLTLAALADELPDNASVILWGVPPHVHARMCIVSAASEKWLFAGSDSDPTEIVDRCVKLVR